MTDTTKIDATATPATPTAAAPHTPPAAYTPPAATDLGGPEQVQAGPHGYYYDGPNTKWLRY